MRSSRFRADAAIIALLVLLTAGVFGQAVGFGFTWLDDPPNVSRNPNLAGGLSPAALRWALTSTSTGNWHPLTWISHLLDVEAYGLSPGGHHLTSVLLHAANAALIYALLRSMTGARWRSAIVAALFAVHPLRAESVVWIAERKDVLAGFFWLLSVLLYLRYARRPTLGRYLAVLGAFGLGLASKAVLVTLPLILLLLDVWPLGRLRLPGERGSVRARPLRPLLLEKIPLLAGSVVISAVAYRTQANAGAIDPFSLPEQIATALIATALYLGKAVWPADLSIFYPRPVAGWATSAVVAAACLLTALTAGALLAARRHPWLPVGWLWYLIALAPMSGLVKIGGQAMADRYTYLPLIGVTLAVVWSAAACASAGPAPRLPIVSVAVLAIAALAVAGWSRTRLWRDDVFLYGQAAQVAPGNWLAETALGSVYAERGDPEAAERHFRAALQANRDYLGVNANYALFLARRGRLAEARAFAERGMEVNPVQGSAFGLPTLLATMDRAPVPRRDDVVERRFREGARLAGEGRDAAAAAAFEAVLAADPGHAAAHNNLGSLLARRGDLQGAIAHFRRAIESRPGYAEAHYNLGNALAAAGDLEGAAASFQQALRLKPDAADIANNLGVVQERLGRLDDARASYREALRLAPEHRAARANLDRSASR